MIFLETDIDNTILEEYWVMSKDFKVRRYDRMLWATDKYYKEFKAHFIYVPRVNIYKALEILLEQMEGK
tara:strand:- start:539 stop:745 length:207 start_codon:yes stop_codon:yes gene_type:complete